MKLETIKVYKGSKDVTINKTDLEQWRGDGWVTSSERQKAKKGKKNVSTETEA